MENMIIADGLTLAPKDYASQGNTILGIRGSGKSYTASKIAEELLKEGIPILVFDPTGIWRHLRDGVNGHEGFPVVVVGGIQPDIPITLDEEKMDAIIEKVVILVRAAMQKGISIVVDLFAMPKSNWQRIVVACIRLLLKENYLYGIRHVILEEAAEFCLTPDTEILTEKGWKKYDQLTIGERAICYNTKIDSFENGEIQKIIVRDYSGELLNFKNRQLDILVTPDHRNLIRRFKHNSKRYKKYDLTFCAASMCPKQFIIPGAKNISYKTPHNNTELSTEILRIMGWVITDGFFNDKRKNTLKIEQSVGTKKMGVSICSEMMRVFKKYSVGIYFRKERGKKIIAKNKKPTVTNDSFSFFLKKELSTKLLKHFPDGNIHRIPRDILQNCDWHQLVALYNGLMEGDGTGQGKKWRYFYAGLNEGLADDFHELCTLIGVRAIKRKVPQNQQWRISISGQKEYWIQDYPNKIYYKGIVWDVTVPSGAFVARRNGQVWITGNCPQRPHPGNQEVYGLLEQMARTGRNFGIGYTLINQRAEEIAKAVFELCEMVFVHRQKGKNSLRSIREWLDHQAIEAAKGMVASIPKLANGECWVISEQGEQKVSILQKETFHPSPKEGKVTVPHDVKVADRGEFIKMMLEEMSKAVGKDKKREKNILQDADQSREIGVLTEQLEKTKAYVFELQNEILQHEKNIDQLKKVTKTAHQKASEIRESIISLAGYLVSDAVKLTENEKKPHRGVDVLVKSIGPNGTQPLGKMKFVDPSDNGELPIGEKTILVACFQFKERGGLNRKQLCIICFYKRSSVNTYLQRLVQKNYLQESGSKFSATAAGIKLLGKNYQPLPRGKALQQYWLGNLPEGEKRVFQTILMYKTKRATREELEGATLYARSTVNTYLQRLVSREIVEITKDGAKLSDFLNE